MSRINVENIRHPDAASDSLQLSDTGNITAPGNLSVTGTSTLTGNVSAGGNLSVTGTSTLTGNTVVTGSLTANGLAYPTAGPLGNRNLIINGSFQVDQRNSGSAVTPAVTTAYTVDRFRALQSVASTLTVQQQTAVVPAGFTHAVEITLAANRTPTAAQQFFFGTTLEANNLGHLRFGAAGAAATILSFWVRASVTGTYSVSWTNDANNRSYIGTYTINTADTWEHKTVTFTGDTTGTWANSGTARHSFLSWDLGAGSDFDGTADTWQTGNLRKTAASVDFVSGTNGDTFYLTGVQLEVGEVATSFEHRSYGDELARCQRYFQGYNAATAATRAAVSYDNFDTDAASDLQQTTLIGVGTVVDGDDARIVGTFSVPMRTRPTVTGVDLRLMTGVTLHNSTTTVQANVSSIYALTLLIDNASTMTAADCAHLIIKGNGNLFFDAEF